MALKIPTSLHYITFPLSSRSRRIITWSEEREEASAAYYNCKCYWGPLEEPSSVLQYKSGDVSTASSTEAGNSQSFSYPTLCPDARIRVEGETQIWIAAELIEASFRGGPLSPFHLRDLAKWDERTKEPRWITMLLDDCFHYGQTGSADTLSRWLVYHPAIAPTLKSPRMFQHRFTDLVSAEVAEALVDDMTDVVPEDYKKPAEVGSQVLKFGIKTTKSVFGHYLHRYLNSTEIVRAKNVADHMKSGQKTDGLTDEERLLVVCQFLETKRVKAENLIAKNEFGKHADMIGKRREADEKRKKMNERKVSLLQRWFGIKSSVKGAKAEKIEEGKKEKIEEGKKEKIEEEVKVGDFSDDLIDGDKSLEEAVSKSQIKIPI